MNTDQDQWLSQRKPLNSENIDDESTLIESQIKDNPLKFNREKLNF